MDFPRLQFLIEQSVLYFANVYSLLDYDKKEGELSGDAYNFLIDNLAGDTAYAHIKKTKATKIADIHLTGNRTFDLSQIRMNAIRSYNFHKNWLFVNCCSINEHESYAMRGSYTTSNRSIAIKTNLNSLKSAVIDTKNIICNKIKYIKPTEAKLQIKEKHLYTRGGHRTVLTYMLQHKRIEFIDEKELRLIYNDDESLPRGVAYGPLINKESDLRIKPQTQGNLIQVNIEALIDKIILHPNSDRTFRNDVISLLSNNNFSSLESKVVNSSI